MRTFRPYDLDQPYLLPPDLRSWLSEGHLALFVSDVVDALDLSSILDAYERGDGRGYPPYHPVMMVKLLVYGYCTGKISSRKIEKATWEDVAYRVLSGNQQPDHDSIAEFRRRHLKALAGLFVQVLKLCQGAGLVKLGHVSVDGSKVKANASRHKAMSYQRLTETEARLIKEVDALLAEAEAIDNAEDSQYGKGKRGDELPEELKRRETRLKKIREAKAALEAEAKAKAQAQAEEARKRIAERERQEAQTGKKIGGVPPRIPDPEQAVPDPKSQKNFTDPESRIMLDGATKGYVQAFNAQIAVDADSQIIVAVGVTQDAVDNRQLAPLLMAVEANAGQLPGVATADNGYFNPDAITDERLADVDLFVATARERKPSRLEDGPLITPAATTSTPALATGAAPATVVQQMRDKLATEAGKATYKLRKCIPEPVFGQIKEGRGFRRFSFRGLAKVTAEWSLVALTHNLLKLFRSGWKIASSDRVVGLIRDAVSGA
ncbi:MAG: IS1182 family transposase [Actinobacteria bacterium]|nr:IS1182 family transposase [Actinomycetota bacterium]